MTGAGAAEGWVADWEAAAGEADMAKREKWESGKAERWETGGAGGDAEDGETGTMRDMGGDQGWPVPRAHWMPPRMCFSKAGSA